MRLRCGGFYDGKRYLEQDNAALGKMKTEQYRLYYILRYEGINAFCWACYQPKSKGSWYECKNCGKW